MNLPKLVRSVWHTRPSQLAARLRRILRCRAHDRWPEREERYLAGSPPAACELAPRPRFEPRLARARRVDGQLQAWFLNGGYPLEVPVDWNGSGLVELQAMNLHYMEYLEALDDEAFAALVEDWITHNRPGRPGSWRIGWNSFVVSLRALVWMQQLAVRRESLHPSLLELAHESLAMQLRFLARHLELDLGGNHLIKNAKTLLWGGRYFAGPEAQSWRNVAESLLLRELREQVLLDGMHYELSPAYHLQVLADLLECLDLASAPLRQSLRPELERMLQAAVDLTHPDGAPSLFNDGGMHMTYSIGECLAVAGALGLTPPGSRRSFSLPQAGYFGLRRDGHFLLIDCGPLGPDHLPAHGHGDALAFEWTVGGERLIVDAGVTEYERGPWRDLSRATASHNTLTLNDLDQSEFWAAFRVGRRARTRVESLQHSDRAIRLTGSHDGYRHLPGAPIHQRTFNAEADQISVVDEVTGGAGQTVRARLLLHPGVSVEQNHVGATLRRGRETVVLTTKQELGVIDAWWFPDFGVRERTRCLVMEYGRAPCAGAFDLRRVATS